jgi:hypothetical protein
MALDSYTNLKAELADWLDRPDMTSRIETFIDLCEAKLSREIRVRAMLKRATSSTSIVGRYMALPSGYRAMKILRLNTTPVTVLEQCNETELTRRLQAATGKPEFFAIHEEIEFNRVPDEVYTAEMIYYSPLTPLSDDNASNWILANAPDLYLYGALSAAEPFLDNDERLATWKGLYNDAAQAINLEDQRSRTSGPQIARTRGATP